MRVRDVLGEPSDSNSQLEVPALYRYRSGTRAGFEPATSGLHEVSVCYATPKGEQVAYGSYDRRSAI